MVVCIRGHKSQATKFYMVVPNICGATVWNLLYIDCGTKHFEVTPRFLRNIWNPAV